MAILRLLALLLAGAVVHTWARPINITSTWFLPEEGFPVFYRYFKDKVTWNEADAICEFHHGDLVTVDTTRQRDAARAYVRELDIVDNVWIGLIKESTEKPFTWMNGEKLLGEGYWQEPSPVTEEPLCAAMDPIRDFRWASYMCGGPQTGSFICELPVPDWAMRDDGCMITSLPSLSVTLIPELGVVELISDCGMDGTRRITCRGSANREEMIRRLSCDRSEDMSSSTTHSGTRLTDMSSGSSGSTGTTGVTRGWSYDPQEPQTRHRRDTKPSSPGTPQTTDTGASISAEFTTPDNMIPETTTSDIPLTTPKAVTPILEAYQQSSEHTQKTDPNTSTTAHALEDSSQDAGQAKTTIMEQEGAASGTQDNEVIDIPSDEVMGQSWDLVLKSSEEIPRNTPAHSTMRVDTETPSETPANTDISTPSEKPNDKSSDPLPEIQQVQQETTATPCQTPEEAPIENTSENSPVETPMDVPGEILQKIADNTDKPPQIPEIDIKIIAEIPDTESLEAPAQVLVNTSTENLEDAPMESPDQNPVDVQQIPEDMPLNTPAEHVDSTSWKTPRGVPAESPEDVPILLAPALHNASESVAEELLNAHDIIDIDVVDASETVEPTKLITIMSSSNSTQQQPPQAAAMVSGNLGEVEEERGGEELDEVPQRPNRGRLLTQPQHHSFYPYFLNRVLG